MRKLIPFLIALQLSMVLIGSFGFYGVLAQENAPGGSAPSNAVSGQRVDCGPVTPNSGTSTVDMSDSDIMVLLTEGIKSGGEGALSCGEIIYCLREGYGKQNKATADANVIAQLKKDYSHCIVAGKDGLDLLNNYAALVYQWIAGIVGAICVLMVIVSGIQISMGGLSPDEVNEAKERIIRSLTGMVVLFLSAFILYTINPIFFS